MSRTPAKAARIVLGATPRADLLPPEVEAGIRARSVRRRLIGSLVGLLVLVAAAYAGSSLLASESERQLAASIERTQDLLAEQGEYIAVRSVSRSLDAVKQAREIGASTEVDWKEYVAAIQASLPAGTIVTNFAADTATPMAPYSLPSGPLQGERMGELSFTATSASLPDVEAWLDSLAELTGFVDASPGSVTLAEDGTYTVGIVMHINEEVLANRFVEEED